VTVSSLNSMSSASAMALASLFGAGLLCGDPALAIQTSTPLCTFAPDEDLGVPPITRGKSDTFFNLAEDFREPTRLNPETAAFFRWLNSTLHDQRTQLIVVWTPARGYSLSEFVDPNDPSQRVYVGAEIKESSDEVVTQLRDLGLTIVDLTEIGSPGDATPFFLKREPFWTSEGAKRAAQVVKDEILSNPAYENLPKVEVAPRLITAPALQSTMLTEIRRACRQSFEPEIEPRYVFEPIVTSRLAQADEASPSSILLAGSGNVSAAASDFAGYLSQYTQLTIENQSAPQDDPFASLLNAVSTQRFKEAPPRYLVWEIPASTNINNRAPASMRQIIPAANRVCDAPDALAEATSRLVTEKQPLLSEADFGGRPLDAREAFLELSVPPNTGGTFDLTIEYDNGELDLLTVGDPTNSSRTKFYGWLSPEIAARVDSISIRNVPADGLLASARICTLVWPEVRS
jgi:alginate biosynthesis protein AlgX